MTRLFICAEEVDSGLPHASGRSFGCVSFFIIVLDCGGINKRKGPAELAGPLLFKCRQNIFLG